MGSGAAKRLSAVRWGVAGNIAVAWALTLPAAAIVGALAYLVTEAFGSVTGPVVIAALMLGIAVVLLARRARHAPAAPLPEGP